MTHAMLVHFRTITVNELYARDNGVMDGPTNYYYERVVQPGVSNVMRVFYIKPVTSPEGELRYELAVGIGPERIEVPGNTPLYYPPEG